VRIHKTVVMKKSTFIVYFLLVIFCYGSSFAQNNDVQSLLHYLQTSKFIECDSVLKATRLNATLYLKEDTNKIKILLKIVGCLANFGPHDTTKEYSKELTALSDKLNFKRADSHWLAATIVSSTPEAVRGYLLTIKIAEEIRDTPLLAAAYGRLGLEYYLARNYPAAVDAYFKRLKLAGPDGHQQIPTLENLSNVYAAQKKYDEALKIIHGNISANYRRLEDIGSTKPTNEEERNIKRVDSMETLKQIATDKINAADVYKRQKQFEQATRFYNEVINDPDMKRLGNFNGVGYYPIMALYYLSDLYLQQTRQEISKTHDFGAAVTGKLDSALICAQLFIARWKQYYYMDAKNPNSPGNKRLNVYLYPLWGRYYYTMGLALSGKRAIALYDSSIYYFEKYMADSLTRAQHSNCYSDLFKVYSAKHDYKNAAKNADLYNRDRDSIVNNETNNQIEQLRIQYEVETAIAKEKTDRDKELMAEKARYDKELNQEMSRQEQLAAQEKARHEKTLLEEKYRHEAAMAEQKFKEEQLLSEQKIKDAQELAAETARLQSIEADEKLRHEKALYEEQIKHQTMIIAQKRIQDKALAQKQRRNNQMLMGSGALFLSGLFTLLFIRQRSEKKRAIERAQALHRMTELELQSLRAQLNPHFMFNSLNAIQELILLEENDKSHAYLTRFAKLVRMLLDNADQPFISLEKEIEFLELYLSLENLRVPDLNYSIEMATDIFAEQVIIPNMILQPYIENAIWHGLSHKMDERRLQVKIFRKADGIAFHILDNGVGRRRAEELKSQYRQQHNSKGMELLSKRFKLLAKEYGTDIKTSIVDLIEGNHPLGTLVEIIVPQLSSEPLNQISHVANYHS
jgi:hypothetical protein